MKKKRKKLLAICFLLFSAIVFSQEGTVSGILSDEDGPIPGVSIIIKGTKKGTDSDFDGEYSIQCKVGDVLVFSYLGFKTREVMVTPQMFGESSNNNINYISVKLLNSDAYAKALEKLKKNTNFASNIETSKRTYNKNTSYFQYNRVKEIRIDSNKVKLNYFSPDIYFEVGYSSSFGAQFIRNKNLPSLQRSFSQGIPVSGELTFQGAETGNVFSYGPALNSLEFDGSNYAYDTNGLLVNQGNGIPANSYNNSIFENVLSHSHHVFFNVTSNEESYDFNFSNKSIKDIFNRERNTDNKLSLSYNKKKRSNQLGWNAFVNYQTKKDYQPNINGFQNNVLFNLWSTPPSFSNSQGAVLSDNSQRSFNSQFNNPEWLLNFNRNSINDDLFVASIQNDLKVNDEINFDSRFTYKYNDQLQQFGLVNGTAGFNNGFSSNKNIKNHYLNSMINFHYKKYKDGNETNIKSVVDYTYESLDFSLLQSSGFNPFTFINALNNVENEQSISRSKLKLLNQFKYEVEDQLEFQFTNNSYFSSIQNNKWFLPSLDIKLDFTSLFYIDLEKLSLTSSVSFDVNDLPLYYNNLSHNSLLISPQESLSYTTNNDLFINSSLALEEKRNYEINASLGLYLFDGITEFNFTYYNSKTKGSIFPTIENGAFELNNVADIRNSGFEFSIDSRIRIADEFYYTPKVSFSTYNTKVLSLLNGEERIPIAGFSTVSKNLVVDQPAGVIIGSAYARNSQNQIIIGNDGFPLVSSTLQIIGNPIPDYNLGFSNHFKWKKLELNFVLEIQKGGDIWNGTQNTLNYLGTSQQSADERAITNFVFNGVNQQGNTNTTQVNFYNPANSISENRFVRYGFEGVAEEAIVDASFVNIKSIDLLYSFFDNYYDKNFIRECKLGIYAKNVFTWSKFRGRNPYGSLYGNFSGQELNFFNTPLLSEVGVTLKIKI